MTHPLDIYLRSEILPTVFCPGCGNGIVMSAFLRAVNRIGYKDLKKFVFVSGIGCAAWIPSPYIKADSIHVAHGRAIPVATGLKLYRPELEVIVFGGDGDIAGIGGNHLLHAARRNIDILTIMVNNMVYGMTGGQLSPTTPINMRTTTTPYGNPERPLDVCKVVSAAGANYVARWTVIHTKLLSKSFEEALKRKGFRYIEVVSPCTSRVVNKMKLTPADYLRFLLKASIKIEKVKGMHKRELRNKIIIGKYRDVNEEGYIERIHKIAGRQY